MEQQNGMLKSIANFSDEQYLAVFNVEELERRLETGCPRIPEPWELPGWDWSC